MLQAEQALLRAQRAQGSLLLLSGEAGIGKSRLAERISEGAISIGFRVAWGRAWEAGGAPSYWPWLEIFRSLELDPGLLPRQSQTNAGGDARFFALDNAATALVQRCVDTPLLLVLDDLHAADAASLVLLQLICQRAPTSALCVVGTYREAEARGQPEHSRILQKLARQAQVHSLRRLDSETVGAWLEQVAPTLAPRAEEIFRLTEGNPLFVSEITRAALQRPELQLPDGLAAVLDDHLRLASNEVLRILQVASVLGRQFTIGDVALLATQSADQVSALLLEAANMGLLEIHDGADYRFSHVLLRDRAYQSLSWQERAELHWSWGLQLQAQDAVSAAHHLLNGVTHGDAAQIAPHCSTAVGVLLDQLSFEAAAELAQRSLDALKSASDKLEPSSPGVRSSELHLELQLSSAWMGAGLSQPGRAAAVRAFELAKEEGDAVAMAQAALTYSAELTSAAVDRLMVQLLEGALEALSTEQHLSLRSNDSMRARLLARLAAALTPPDGVVTAERIQRFAAEARRLVQAIQDPPTELYVLSFLASALGYTVSSDERFSLSREIVRLATLLNQKQQLLIAHPWYAINLLERGLRAEAEATIESYQQLMRQSPPAHRWRGLMQLAALASLDGDFDAAATLGNEALEVAVQAESRSGQVAWALQRVALAHGRGKPASIAAEAERVLSILARLPTLLPYRAWVLAATGQRTLARELMREVVLNRGSYPWLIIAADAAVLLDDAETAVPIYESLQGFTHAQRFFWGPATAFVLGPTERCLGDLALLLGNREAAADHYRVAIEHCAAVGAHALKRLAESGLQRTLGTPKVSQIPAMAPPKLELRRVGEEWELTTDQNHCYRFKHSKGFTFLQHLLEHPCQRLHVFELLGVDERPLTAEAVLDPAAKQAYRTKLQELAEDLDSAEQSGDAAAAERIRFEHEQLLAELCRALGLGSRDRRFSSGVEKARVNVQRRLKDAVNRIAEQDETLGKWLRLGVKTGTFCSYEPV